MAPSTGRRSRTLESDSEDNSRLGTPASTAPNDSKRARHDRPASQSVEPDSLTSSQQRLALNPKSMARPKHQPGAIVRVKLTNFVTYTAAEFFPGPNLNM